MPLWYIFLFYCFFYLLSREKDDFSAVFYVDVKIIPQRNKNLCGFFYEIKRNTRERCLKLLHNARQLEYKIDNTPKDACRDAVYQNRPCDDKHFCPQAENKAFCLCQVYPKRFFYFPVEIRQEFFFLYYEASSGIHSPIISVRYLLFSPISIRPLSNTRTSSISRLITSGRYSVKA